MIKYKRQSMATKLPGFRVQLHHIFAAVFISILLGWSTAFIVINPQEICYLTDLGPHDMLGGK
jgi:hypothetical protein